MIKKKFVKSRKTFKVTFEIPKTELPGEIDDIENIALVGDFNDWDCQSMLMRRNKRGAYRVEVELKPEQHYHFRYVANGDHWFNDWEADAYTENEFGTENCVVETSLN